MYSMALGLRCFKWKMLSLSGPNALLFLQLLIVLITRTVVNVCAISKYFFFVSLVTNRVSFEEVCLPSFDVLNCWLNLATSCFDDENELSLKVIASFSVSTINSFNGSPQLGDIQGQQDISIFSFCVRRCGSGCHNSVLAVQVRWDLLYVRSSRLVITSNISAGTGSSWSLCRPVGMWCDAALSRIVRKIIPSLWQYVGRERLLRAASTSCLYLSQLAFFMLT